MIFPFSIRRNIDHGPVELIPALLICGEETSIFAKAFSSYDALGNLIYRQLPNGENQYYQYDLENQLVRAEIKKPAGNTEIWEYAYDPFGRRLSKERQDKLAWTSTDPKRTHFVWDGTRLLQEYTYKGSYTYKQQCQVRIHCLYRYQPS